MPQFGTAGRNIAQGTGYVGFLGRQEHNGSGGQRIPFRAEFFNFLNHPNFPLPDSDISSPTFKQILAAQSPRLIQLGLEFQF